MKSKLINFLSVIIFMAVISCKTEVKNQDSPNVLWLVAEDLSPYISAFGDNHTPTPNLDRLATEGVVYTKVFSVSGVCAPSRSAITTGMYPNSIGAHNMRTLHQQPGAKELGLINYECVPPPYVKMVSEIMRENGYYCTNNFKEDYQFEPSIMAWDESSVYAHWKNRPKGKPFYAVFNFNVTHESGIWNSFGQPYDMDTFPPKRSIKTWWKQFEGKKKPLFVPQDLEVTVPPYLPNTEVVRNDIIRMYSNIVEMDRQVGRVLKQLETDGLLENTIIVWYSDHGGPLPRQKRLLYDSGLNVPMIIRYPNKFRAGEHDNRLISFVDFAPTLLSMVGIKSKKYMKGQAFEGEYKSNSNRKYIYAASDRFDECYDMIRAVRDNRFKYLKNFHSDQPYYLPIKYRESMPSMQELLRMRDTGTLNEVQMQWFRKKKPIEELFDLENDPNEINNLADDAIYSAKLTELRTECERWMEEINDNGFIPEKQLIRQFWPGLVQPTTKTPSVKLENGKMVVSCLTDGGSIGYKYPEDDTPWTGWRIYRKPVKVPSGKEIKVIAHHIGYTPSKTVLFEN